MTFTCFNIWHKCCKQHWRASCPFILQLTELCMWSSLLQSVIKFVTESLFSVLIEGMVPKIAVCFSKPAGFVIAHQNNTVKIRSRKYFLEGAGIWTASFVKMLVDCITDSQPLSRTKSRSIRNKSRHKVRPNSFQIFDMSDLLENKLKQENFEVLSKRTFIDTYSDNKTYNSLKSKSYALATVGKMEFVWIIYN